MPIPLSTKDLNDVPEQYREHYTKGEDGVFYQTLVDVSPMKRTIAHVRAEKTEALDKAKEADEARAAAENRLSRFKDIDPEKAKEHAEIAAKVAKGDIMDDDKRKALESAIRADVLRDVSGKHGEEMAKAKAQIDALQTENDDHAKRVAVAAALRGYDVKLPDLLEPYLLSQLDVVREEKDGQITRSIIVRGEGGRPRISQRPDDDGPMSVKEFVGGLQGNDSFKAAFGPQSDKTGTGAGQNQQTPTHTGKKYSEMTDAEQAAFVRSETEAGRNGAQSLADLMQAEKASK